MENYYSIIVGGFVALISSVVTIFINEFNVNRKFKKQFKLEKLNEILDNINLLEESVQKDISSIFTLTKIEDKEIRISFYQNKLSLLLKTYHKDLSLKYVLTEDLIDKYLKKKVKLVNLLRMNPHNDIKNEIEELIVIFEKLIEELKIFMKEISIYGNKII